MNDEQMDHVNSAAAQLSFALADDVRASKSIINKIHGAHIALDWVLSGCDIVWSPLRSILQITDKLEDI